MAAKRKWRKRVIAGAGAALVLGAVGIAIGPAAPWIIDHVTDGVKIGRFGRLKIDGVSGSWLGNLRVTSLALEDDQGVWAEAHNVAVNWRPMELLLNANTRLDAAHAESISVLRQPHLSAAEPPHAATFHVEIAALRVDHISIAEPVLGAAGVFTLAGALDLSSETLAALDVELTRHDSDADHAFIHFHGGAPFALHADVVSAPGGLIGRALGLPNTEIKLSGDGAGVNGDGEAHLASIVGGAPLASGTLSWRGAQWSGQAEARLDTLPATAELKRRFGDHLTLAAQGAPNAPFTAHAASPNIVADLDGRLKADNSIDGVAHVVATTPRISSIAPEAPFELGAARFEGQLRSDAHGLALDGQIDGRGLQVLGRTAQLSGPVRAQLTDAAFTLEADLRVPEHAPALFAHARAQTHLSFDRARGRFSLDSARVDGDAISADASGWAKDGDGQFAGTWRTRDLGAWSSGLRGEASGRWRAFATQAPHHTYTWSTAFDGRGARISGAPEIVPQLLGDSPRLDGLVRFERGGITVEHVRVDGAQLRAGAVGRIVNGNADLHLEASARGPLSIGDAEIAGAVDATGQLTGPIARPSLRAHAQLASFTAGGVEITQPDVTVSLLPAGSAYRGQAEMQGRYGDQVVAATSGISIANSSLGLPNLIAHVGALTAQGEAAIAPRGLTAQLALSGALDGLAPGLSGRVQGNARLAPDAVAINAQIADARAGDLRVRAATLSANGPYRAIVAHYDLRGALKRAPLTLAGDATVHVLPAGTDLSIQGTGALAGAALTTRTPILARWTHDGLDAALDVALADGGLTAHWRERGRVLQGIATIGEAPIAPLAAIMGERATGRIAGNVQLVNTGGGLSGDARVTLTDARFEGRQRGALSGTFVAHLDPSRLTGNFDARSSDGLIAHFEADAPVTTSAAPVRIALAPQRRGSATWSVRGPAGALWAATRLTDQDLEGDLSGEGHLSFGAGYLAGDGQIQIANGRFEDKVSGVKLQNVDAAMAINQDGVTLQRFTAQDSRGGRVTATGGSANPREGRIALEISDLRMIDRPDAHARASGQLTLAWQGMDAQLTGALAISEADISIAQNPQAGIPTMDVVEINRPGDDEEEDAPPARTPFGATQVNVRITAPGRVFTRGRGVDAEWSLDLRLGGTTAAPQLFGRAQTVRGNLSLSGQPFDIDNGVIDFNGDPLDARINLTATRETADLTAHISLTGTASDPDVSFTSSPALPEDEILPQILFGHSVEDLNAIEAAQLAASLAALSGQASFNLVDAARAAAGLDRFDVRQDASGGFLVAGGVYLTRGVYVEVGRTGLGQATTRVEWTVRPKLVLITSFLQNGDQRASIRWRRETD